MQNFKTLLKALLCIERSCKELLFAPTAAGGAVPEKITLSLNSVKL